MEDHLGMSEKDKEETYLLISGWLWAISVLQLQKRKKGSLDASNEVFAVEVGGVNIIIIYSTR